MEIIQMPYSLDLRKRAMTAIQAGMSKTKASEVYQICRKTLYNWLYLEQAQGHLAAKSKYQKGHSHGIKDLASFRGYVDRHPDYTQEEIAEHFSVGSSTVGRALKKLGYSRKKRVKPMQKEAKKKDGTIKRKSKRSTHQG